MAVSIAAADPAFLLKGILARFDQRTIEGWCRDGECFTLTDPEWSTRAYLRPLLQTENLVLGLVPTEGQGMSKELYAVYHGRFIDMLLRHFSDVIGSVQLTTGRTSPDLMHWTGDRRSSPDWTGDRGSSPSDEPGE